MDAGEGVNVGVGADVAGTEASLVIRTVVGVGVGVEVKNEAPKIREVSDDSSSEVDAVDGDRPRERELGVEVLERLYQYSERGDL